jgi:hypothetical protein
VLHALAGLPCGAVPLVLGRWLADRAESLIVDLLVVSAAVLVAVAAVVALAIFGWGREVRQHDPDLTLHQRIEAWAWPAGAVLGALGVALWWVVG